MISKYLVKSTSGVRGVIGKGLTASMFVDYGAALGTVLLRKAGAGPLVVGRDSRPSGEHLSKAFIAGAQSVGMPVVDLGIVPTPTVELAIPGLKARGGVCITASHNPSEWNALKFFNDAGEFINEKSFLALELVLASRDFKYKPHDKLGTVTGDDRWIERHIAATLKLPGVSAAVVRRRKFTVVVDAVNGAGSLALPEFVERLGAKVVRLHCEPTGLFPRAPEPTPERLSKLSEAVRRHKADLGLACDPDADRLALVDETGRPIGEELTLTLAVEQVLRTKPTTVAVNLSTSRATVDVARRLGAKVYLSRVGEANVVAEMKKRGALIGGEGNGGVIYGALHYGRDSLVGAGLVLTLLAKAGVSLSTLAGTIPRYYNTKTKAPLPEGFESRLEAFAKAFKRERPELTVDDRDGVRMDFNDGWLLIRKSNTEPIYRIVVETNDAALTRTILARVKRDFKQG
ncbi:MAG TPA: phosphoglucosamine mutase [candidate division Zixibacteria bacterium]|nr:phosphoglucosamine mutase [candidate division Zixibacteria bacterium]